MKASKYIKVKAGSFQQATFDTGVYQHVSTVLAWWLTVIYTIIYPIESQFLMFFFLSQLVKNGKLWSPMIQSRLKERMLEGALDALDSPWQRDASGGASGFVHKKTQTSFYSPIVWSWKFQEKWGGLKRQMCRCITCHVVRTCFSCATIFGTGEMQVATPMAPHIGTLKKKKGGPKSSHIREILAKKHDERRSSSHLPEK